MKILLALALCCGLVGIAHAQTTLEIRLAEEQPAAGLKEATVAHSDKKVYLYESTVLTNADVADARVVPAREDTFSVSISLTPEGSTKIMDATQRHMGKPLAILVNGSVIAAPIVRSTIQQEAVINGDWTRQEAENIARGLTGK
jgi:preprotein translocase subunit SecD